MSTSLYWRLPPKMTKENYLDTSLKYLLGRKIWDGDGSSGQEPTVVTRTLIPYLDGVMDGAEPTSDLSMCKKVAATNSRGNLYAHAIEKSSNRSRLFLNYVFGDFMIVLK